MTDFENRSCIQIDWAVTFMHDVPVTDQHILTTFAKGKTREGSARVDLRDDSTGKHHSFS
jgi:hypothetical protein